MSKLKVIGGIVAVGALALGVTACISSCVKNNKGAYALEPLKAEMPNNIDVIDEETYTYYLELNTNTNYSIPFRTYYTINVAFDSSSQRYYYNWVSSATYVYGRGLEQSYSSATVYMPSNQMYYVDDSYWLEMRGGYDEDGDYFLRFNLREYDPVRNNLNQQSDYIYSNRAYGDGDYIADLLNDTYNFNIYNYVNNNIYNDRIYLFSYIVESNRLNERIMAYNSGYYDGILDGIQRVYDDPHKYNLYDNNDLGNAYSKGYNAGFADADGNSIPNLVMTIFNAPVAILGGILNFEIFGVNVKNLVFFLLTLGLVIWIISIFKSKGGDK